MPLRQALSKLELLQAEHSAKLAVLQDPLLLKVKSLCLSIKEDACVTAYSAAIVSKSRSLQVQSNAWWSQLMVQLYHAVSVSVSVLDLASLRAAEPYLYLTSRLKGLAGET